MTETYTSGTWIVTPGEEDSFVQEWTAFVTWASSMPGSGTFRLVRDLDRPGTYVSFAPWESFEAQRAWKELPEFRERIGRVRGHCEDFQPSTHELVEEVQQRLSGWGITFLVSSEAAARQCAGLTPTEAWCGRSASGQRPRIAGRSDVGWSAVGDPEARTEKWPDSLDALVAAPESHSLVFENDAVRVLETRIAPGETTPVHTHRWPGILYVHSFGHFVRRDHEGTILIDTRPAAVLPQPGTVLWSEALPPHSLENVDTSEIHVINVELKHERAST